MKLLLKLFVSIISVSALSIPIAAYDTCAAEQIVLSKHGNLSAYHDSNMTGTLLDGKSKIIGIPKYGDYFISAPYYSDRVFVQRISDNSLIRTIPLRKGIISNSLISGTKGYLAVETEYGIEVYNISTGELIALYDYDPPVKFLDNNAYARLLCFTDNDGKLTFIKDNQAQSLDLSTNRLAHIAAADNGLYTYYATSPIRNEIAVLMSDASIQIRDLSTWKLLKTITPPNTFGSVYGPYPSIVYSPDGKYLAALSSNTTICVFDTENAFALKSTLTGNGSSVAKPSISALNHML